MLGLLSGRPERSSAASAPEEDDPSQRGRTPGKARGDRPRRRSPPTPDHGGGGARAPASRTAGTGAWRRLHASARGGTAGPPRPGDRQVEGDSGAGRQASPGAAFEPRPAPISQRGLGAAAAAARAEPPSVGAGRPPVRARTESSTVPVVASRSWVSRPSPPPLGSGWPPSPTTRSYVVPGYDRQRRRADTRRPRRHRRRPGRLASRWPAGAPGAPRLHHHACHAGGRRPHPARSVLTQPADRRGWQHGPRGRRVCAGAAASGPGGRRLREARRTSRPGSRGPVARLDPADPAGRPDRARPRDPEPGRAWVPAGPVARLHPWPSA